ncbi:class I SAM-dependent methyltransferase [Pararhodospirillum oryzae]|uniref:ATP synthase subunit beta n=1 Tax=Pararhodospirillum oryzae TaxID=478448 RepID=A0A512H7Q2_9PROT|nr:SAM-dependent methyltransferase [Pararhodospirillum oryzae]GEO81464.1 ATP synthase subunit beta [Pararhodospirillum oryzae]
MAASDPPLPPADAAPPLMDALRARLQVEGTLDVETWMGLCLEAYYGQGTAIGAQGDFITAPEVSQMVGELLGLWAAVTWMGMGQPPCVHLVEAGPGRGTLMADALRALAPVPAFRAALRVHLIETSPGLRALQQTALASCGVPVSWHDRLDDVPAGPLIVLANEFLDALPVRQYRRAADGTGWHERRVAPGPAGSPTPLVFVDGPVLAEAPPLLQPAHRAARPGAVVEVCPQAHAFVDQVARRLAADTGAALFLDYGPAASGPGDTVQAMAGHAFVPVLDQPGRVDLTAHVDFQALATTARAAGARVDGVVAQGVFLCQLGLRERASALMAGATARQARDLATAVQRLVDPAAMGTHFKVMGLAALSLPRLAGF